MSGFIIRQAGEIEVNGPDGVERINGLLLEGDVSHIRLAAVWFGERVSVAPIGSPSSSQVAPQPQAGALDPRALKAARTAYQSAIPDGCWHSDGGETDAPIRAAIAAYLASPQPADPAQVTEVLDADKIATWPPLKKALWDIVTFEQLNDGHYINAYDLTDKLHFAVTAAIGAGGQAVASDQLVEIACDIVGDRLEIDYDGDEPYVRSDSIETAVRDALSAVGALSQPHPADERVVEALEPFARLVNSEYDDVPNAVGVSLTFDNGEELGALPFGDFRRAYRALAAKEGR